MRISNKAVFDMITQNLARSSNAMFRANEIISTGKKINRLSDDPVGMVSVLNIRSSMEYIVQLERNINMGNSWLNMAETALTRVEETLVQAKVLCVQMSSANVGETERANAAEVAEGFLQQILSLANTTVGDRYIFAGTNTDTAPFRLDEDGSGNRSVSYTGNGTEFNIEIAKGIRVGVSRDGESVFSAAGLDIFETLIDLKAALESNNVPAIRATMDELDDRMSHIRSLTADTGAKLNRLDLTTTVIQDLRLTYLDRKSQLEDADIAEAVIDLKSKELAYQAALSSSAKVMSMSLLDYL